MSTTVRALTVLTLLAMLVLAGTVPATLQAANATSTGLTNATLPPTSLKLLSPAEPGAWSDVKSVTDRSSGLYYDFDRSFAKPAWPIRRTSLYQGDQWGGTWTEEHDGSMYALMNDRFDFAIASPWEEAPDPPYIIKTRVKVHDPANLVAYGIIFGGNEGSPCPAYRESGCLTHYYRLEVIWDGALKAGFKRIDQHEPDKGHAQGRELISYQYVTGTSTADDWHTWEFRVKPDGIDVYFDGSLFGSTSDTRYVNEPYFGVYVSDDEYKPAIGRFDYYYVTPLSDAIPAEVTITGPTTGTVNVAYAFTATVSPTATQPITYAWRVTGHPLVTRIGGLSDTVTFGWSSPGTKAITVTAANSIGTGHDTHVIAIGDAPSPGDPHEPDDTCAEASALATDGTVQSHTFHQHADVDWAHFTVVSGTTYVLQATSTSASADLVLELYDACGGNLEGSDDAFGADARLIFTAPSGGTYYVKALNHDPATYGSDVTYELSVRVQPSDGVALIVAGHDDGHRLQDNILRCTNTAFRTFLRGGLPRANLRYLSDIDDDAQTDADGDGVSDVDADSTSTNVQDAITNWAAGLTGAATPFFLYLADHGGIDAFLTDGSGDTITPDELDAWLAVVEDTGAPVNVVYEACHSGSFIDGLKAISRPGRVVIASTGRLNNAYPSHQGALFSDAFFTQLGQCKDLYTSYRVATTAVGATGLWQTPWLDDNGDRMHGDRDGDLARQRGLPRCGFPDHPPVIDRVMPPASIVDGDGVLRAQVRDNSGTTVDVWAVVYPPSFEEPAPTEDGTMPDLGLPRVELSDTDGDDEYVGLYEDFTEDGAYHVVVYAQDAAGNHALPAVTTVRTRWWAYLPQVCR